LATPLTRALAKRIGRRGASLAILGFVFLVIGVKALVAPAEATGDQFLIYYMLPSYVRGLLWIVPALTALYAAVRHRPGRDGVGFAALAVPTIFMTSSYLWSTVAYFAGLSDWPHGWASALSWFAILALLSVIAGWAEPALPVREAKHRHRKEP
jgi:hypothetical protein